MLSQQSTNNGNALEQGAPELLGIAVANGLHLAQQLRDAVAVGAQLVGGQTRRANQLLPIHRLQHRLRSGRQ